MLRIDFLREIVRTRKSKRVQFSGVRATIDAITAAKIIETYEGLNARNRKEFIDMPWSKLLDVTERLGRRSRAN